MNETSFQQPAITVTSAASPGTHKIKSDLVVLTYMARQLSCALQQPGSPSILMAPLQDCHKHVYHRIALYQPQQLLASRRLSFVGFVSGRQQATNSFIRHEIERIDALMVAELVTVPGLFSYSSLEVRPGRWYNLVIFPAAETKTHFKTSQAHSYAAYELAPHYYAWIRLHNGTMPAGLTQQELFIQSTKYYSFQEGQHHPDMYEMTYGRQ